MCVRNNFQRFVAQIEYSCPWKVLRKHIRKGWFGLPKSSFGRGKVVCSTVQLRHAHSHAIIIMWFRQTHRHAIIIMWFRQTHRHAIIILWVLHAYRHAITIHSFLWKNSPCYHHLVSSTDTSSCYHHLVCSIVQLRHVYSHAIIIMWFRQTHRHAIVILWVLHAYRHAITMRRRLTHARSFNTARTHAPLTRRMPCFSMEKLTMLSSSSCEFYRHIVMLSSSCDSSLCSPNEDFGRRNKRWNPDFRLIFQLFVAQIEYSRPWKVLRTSGFHLLFLLPKSSFGRDKLYPSQTRKSLDGRAGMG